jgi:hypothetical protein
MRRFAPALAVLVAACTATEPAPTTIEPFPPLASTSATTTAAPTTTATRPPTTAAPGGSQIRGNLPDGTPYTVLFEVPVDVTVQGIDAAIMIDLGDGTSWALGTTSITTSTPAGQRGLNALGRYTIPAANGGFVISIDPGVTAEFPDLEAILDAAIVPVTDTRLPTLDLAPPLRWATDDELPLQMEVAYPGFVVRRGCGELAAACSHTGAAQVISADRVFSGTPGLPAEPVWIESSAPRPVDHAAYLDPGPLSPRGGADVMWTGAEMIVWGGAPGDDRPHDLIDGAAFDPAASIWRKLAPPPLGEPTVTRAAWAGDRMIVVTPDATLAYDPAADTWATLGDGLDPPRLPGFLVWTGDHAVAWTAAGIHVFDRAARTWSALPDPGLGDPDAFQTALRVLDGRLYAIGLSAPYCSGRLVSEWTGSTWRRAPPVSLATPSYADCSWANQTAVAGARLVIWQDGDHPTKAYDPRHRHVERHRHHPPRRRRGAVGAGRVRRRLPRAPVDRVGDVRPRRRRLVDHGSPRSRQRPRHGVDRGRAAPLG